MTTAQTCDKVILASSFAQPAPVHDAKDYDEKSRAGAKALCKRNGAGGTDWPRVAPDAFRLHPLPLAPQPTRSRPGHHRSLAAPHGAAL